VRSLRWAGRHPQPQQADQSSCTQNICASLWCTPASHSQSRQYTSYTNGQSKGLRWRASKDGKARCVWRLSKGKRERGEKKREAGEARRRWTVHKETQIVRRELVWQKAKNPPHTSTGTPPAPCQVQGRQNGMIESMNLHKSASRRLRDKASQALAK
jgi:hypothetical protein